MKDMRENTKADKTERERAKSDRKRERKKPTEEEEKRLKVRTRRQNEILKIYIIHRERRKQRGKRKKTYPSVCLSSASSKAAESFTENQLHTFKLQNREKDESPSPPREFFLDF